MKYGLVSWSFTDGKSSRKSFQIYKTELENLKRGDVVLLETNEFDMMGVFVCYFEKEYDPFEEYRTYIIKKVHTNTIKARIRKRHIQFKDFQLPKNPKKARETKKRLIKFFETDNEELIYRKLIRTFCYGNEVPFKKQPNIKNFYYKQRLVSLYLDKSGVWRILNFHEMPGVKWEIALKNHQILTDLMTSEEVKKSNFIMGSRHKNACCNNDKEYKQY